MRRRCRLFTEEQRDFIEANIKGTKAADLAKMLNEAYGLTITADQIKNYKANHGLVSNLDTKFKRGQVPKNKGTKGVSKPNKTSFKKGHMPHNARPIGHREFREDGYLWEKVAETKPSRFGWKPVQRIIWEETYGPIPEGHVIVFLDGDPLNITLENLSIVSKAQLLIMNRKGLIKKNPELTESGILIAKILDKTYKIKRKRGKLK
jgi:hypothetical protein